MPYAGCCVNGGISNRSGLAVLRLRIADACVFRRAGKRIALLDRDLVFGVALVFARLLAGVGALDGGVLMRVGDDTAYFGVRLTLYQRCPPRERWVYQVRLRVLDALLDVVDLGCALPLTV
jgi:hypothetical protein